MGFGYLNINGSLYLKNNELYDLGIKHFFSTRKGGYSIGNYSEFNLGLYTEDESAEKNLIKALIDNTMNVDKAVFLRQVHGDEIYIVDRENYTEIRGKFGDALITKDIGIPIGVFTADCVPIIVVDYTNKIVAAVHAGWKGTYKKILKKTIEKMIMELNADIENIFVILGPAILSCCFEVGEDVFNKFNFKEKRDGKYYVDLYLENKKQAVDLGILEKNIFLSNICTKCNNDLFYSYRVNNNTGRIGTFISL
ncbi:MAG: peptidoglycan editing factor PgeF [Caloramator sp.]|nr:peptidoglycan editing factor PgeF [Caloramator sp.]